MRFVVVHNIHMICFSCKLNGIKCHDLKFNLLMMLSEPIIIKDGCYGNNTENNLLIQHLINFTFLINVAFELKI